jgi:hypothetical protein
MKQSLQQASQDFFDQQQLSGEQLHALQKQIKTTNQDNKKQPPTYRYSLLVACLAFISVGLISFWTLQSTQNPTAPYLANPNLITQQQMVAAIADEVAKNHIKMKPLDINSNRFSEVQGYFTQLDFLPSASQYFNQSATQVVDHLLGGRYCSIRSVTAAQLRFGDNEQNRTTLYQTEYLPDVFGELPILEQGQAPLVTYAKGLRIEIWVEKQLLMVSSRQELSIDIQELP